MKKLNYVLVFLTAVILTVSCEEPKVKEKLKVQTVSIQPDQIRLVVGESYQDFEVEILPQNAPTKTLSWVSEDEKVAIVDEDGQITAVALGETTVTAQSIDNPSASSSCTVIVESEETSNTTITLSKTDLTLEIGFEEILTPTITPENAAPQGVEWTSDNAEVAIVSRDGVVKAVAVGEATISASIVGATYIKADCKVTVNPEQEPIDGPFTLEEAPLSGLYIEGDTWVITDGGKPSTADFENLRSAIKTANRAISLEFPNLEAFPNLAFYIENSNPLFEPLENLVSVKAPNVTEIGAAAFYRGVSIRTMEVPKTVTVNQEAFINCNALEEIELPVALYIGVNAFDSCIALKCADLPSATMIDDRAYDFCTALTSINMPKVSSVGEFCFDSCYELTEISLPEAAEIMTCAFRHCTKLTTVSLPVATSFGSAAFDACYSLKNVTLPSAVDVADRLFNYCELLQNVSLPKVEVLGDYMFRQCLVLSSVTLATESTIRDFAVHAFDDCLPKNVDVITSADNNSAADGNYWVMLENGEEIHRYGPFLSITGADAFQVGSTFVLETIPSDGSTIDGDNWVITNSNEPSTADFENLRQAILTAGRPITLSLPHLKNVPAGALYIDDNTKLSNLASVTIDIAENIGSEAFKGCNAMTTVDAPMVYNIGDSTFEFCSKLESVKIPKARNIGESAFSFCPALSKMTISTLSIVEVIDPKAFSGTLLANIDLTTGGDNGTVAQDNYWLMIKDGVELYRFGPFKSIKGADEIQQSNEFTLENIPEDGLTIVDNTWIITDAGYPNDFRRLYTAIYTAGREISLEFPNVTGFVAESFYIEQGYNFDNLISVSAPNATAIGDKAFYYCMNLENIDFPNVAFVGEDAFGTCRDLTEVSLPNVETLSDRAFYSCYHLESISLPKVAYLGEYSLGYIGESLKYLLIATESSVAHFDIRTLSGNDLSEVELVTGKDNGTTVNGRKWVIGEDTFGPFKSIEQR